MNLSKNNGFTASDIERYHSGKMSPEERHALEKAALDDPFLADALEGYAFTSTPADDFSKIQSRLDEKLDRKRVVPFFQKYKWLSAAAIVLIIVGAGWLASIVSSQQKTSISIAQKETKPVNKSIPSTQTTSDSLITNKKLETATTDQQINRKEEQQKSIPIPSTNNTVAKRSRQVTGNNKEVPVPNAETMSVTTNAANEHQLRELTVNKEVLPKAQTDKIVDVQQGRSFKNSNNAPARSANDTIKNLNIVLHPIAMDSADVVVVGYGSQKKSKSKYPKVTIDTLEPSEGYTNFDDYVANNLKMPEEFKDKPVSGEVQLSFDVDENGQPTNITVVKSLCQKCDEEAVRLLKEGPKWKKKKNKKGKITFKF